MEYQSDQQLFTEKSMLAQLLRKMSLVRGVEGGKQGTAAEQEVWRQIHEISRDPIKGKDITKSGPED